MVAASNVGAKLAAAVVRLASVASADTTLNVADGPAASARLPGISCAVFAPIDIPKVPKPVMFEIVTVYEVFEPLKPIVPVAVPVVFSVMSPSDRVLKLKLASL
jgi:hypothetical protein